MKDLVGFKSVAYRVIKRIGGDNRVVGLVAVVCLLAVLVAVWVAEIHASVGTIYQEVSIVGGVVVAAAMSVGAVIIVVFAAFSLWRSRQPENRERGLFGKGLAGLALCGLFLAGGAWIDTVALTATRGVASITGAGGAANVN